MPKMRRAKTGVMNAASTRAAPRSPRRTRARRREMVSIAYSTNLTGSPRTRADQVVWSVGTVGL